MKTKNALLALSLVLLLGLLAGCSPKKPGEAHLEADLQVYLGSFEEFDSIEITQQDTSKNGEKETIYCKVVSHDAEASYTKYYYVVYHLVDKEWQFGAVTFVRLDEWKAYPLAGVADSLVQDTMLALRGRYTIDGDEWAMEGLSADSFTIGEHTTNLESYQDYVAVSVVLKDDVLQAEGQLLLEYTFDDGWQYKNFSVTGEFTTSQIPGTELEPSNDALLAEIAKHQFTYGEWVTEQSVSVSANEATNFTAVAGDPQNKGTEQTYTCAFTLEKELATFEANAAVSYKYHEGGGWQIEEVTLNATATAFDVVGTWAGICCAQPWTQYADYPHVTFEIEEVNSDGTLSPITMNFTSPTYSSIVSGYIDLTTLSITLSFEEWVINPPSSMDGTDWQLETNFSGTLYVDESTIRNAEYNAREFVVTKES